MQVPPFGVPQPVTLTTYRPTKGDLVFFEHKSDLVARLISDLDQPHHRYFKISHAAIVDVRDVDGVEVVEVVEDILRDGYSGVKRTLLADVCEHDPSVPGSGRRLLVIPAWDHPCNPFVLLEAECMTIPNSEYSLVQLILAGMAAILRQLPCESFVRQHLWEKVHQKSRALELAVRAKERRLGIRLYFSGTCVAMVAEAHHLAGADLGILEPDCAAHGDPHLVRQYLVDIVAGLSAASGYLLADGLALIEEFAHDMADAGFEPPNFDALRATRERLSEDGGLEPPENPNPNDPPPDGGDPSFIGFEGQLVEFGEFAAGELVRELRRLEMVIADAERWMVRHLHKAFIVADHIVHASRDRSRAPQHPDPVDRPLMTLGLVLDHFESEVRPYAPYS